MIFTIEPPHELVIRRATLWHRVNVGELLKAFSPQEFSNYLRHAGHGFKITLTDSSVRIQSIQCSEAVLTITSHPCDRQTPDRVCSSDLADYCFELGRPGIWLRIDFEKPPSTHRS